MENTTHALGFSSAFLKLQEEPFESVESRPGYQQPFEEDWQPWWIEFWCNMRSLLWGAPQCLEASDSGSRTSRGSHVWVCGGRGFLVFMAVCWLSLSIPWSALRRSVLRAISMGRVLPLTRHSHHFSSCFTTIYLPKPIRFYLQDDYIAQEKQKQSRALGVENFPQKDGHLAGKVPSPCYISLLWSGTPPCWSISWNSKGTWFLFTGDETSVL